MHDREVELEGVNWIHLAQDGDRWWDLENRIINLRIPFNTFKHSAPRS
jgi:hypothetical protein